VRGPRLSPQSAEARAIVNAFCSPQDLNLKYTLTKEDVQTLLKGGLEILNRYSALFDAQMYADSIVGRDDYEGVLDAIRDKLARYDEQRKKEQERTGGKLGPA
jgi:hypothetical protein